MTDVHALPAGDIYPHEEHDWCACEPRVEMEGEDRIIVHNSYDQRELWESNNARIEQ